MWYNEDKPDDFDPHSPIRSKFTQEETTLTKHKLYVYMRTDLTAEGFRTWFGEPAPPNPNPGY